MAIPTFQALGPLKSTTGDATVVWPTHQTGDIALLFVETPNETITLSSAAGFTVIASPGTGSAGAAGSVKLGVYWCRATSGSMASPVIADAGDHILARIATFRGCITSGNPYDVFNSDTGASSTSITIPGATTTVVDTLVIAAVANALDTITDGQVTGWTNANLTSITDRLDMNSSIGVGAGIAFATGGKATAGAYGNTTATLGSASAQARVSLALKPLSPVNAMPTFQAAGTGVSGTGAVTVDWPSHLENDVAFLLCESANEATTLSTAAGFVEIADSPQGTGTAGAATDSTRLTVFWCRATSAAMSSPVVADPGNHIVAQIVTFRGCETSGNPWNVTSGDTLGTASATVTIPGDTTTVDNCLIAAICATGRDVPTAQFSGWTNADLSSVTERTDFFSSIGNGGGFGLATGGKATQGAYGTTVASLAGSANSVQGRISVALKPPAGTAGGGGDPTIPHRYWRIKLGNTPGSGPVVNELELVERTGTVAATNSLITQPAKMHPGVTHIRPTFLVNQGSDTAAQFDLDVAYMTLPAGYSSDIPTDQVTRKVDTFYDADGVLRSGVGQSDGAGVLPLVKGVVRGTCRHGDDITFGAVGRVFQTVPLVEFTGGNTFSPGSTTAGRGFGTAAEVDAGTANDLADTAKPQSQDFSARDLTESGFTANIRLRQKAASVTIRGLAFAGTQLDTLNETDTISTLTNAPSSDDWYFLNFQYQIRLKSTNGTTFRVIIDYEVETSIDSGTTWQARGVATAVAADTTSTVNVIKSGVDCKAFNVSGLTADGTDRIRMKFIGISTEGLGSYVAADTWIKCLSTTGTATYQSAGLNFFDSTDSFCNATPDADDVVNWKASGYI